MLEPLTLWPQERLISATNFFEKLPGKMYFFCFGAPDPQKGTLSPGSVGEFCRAQRVPTFD